LKFLIDNALSHEVAALLNNGGHDAKHVRDWHMESAEDSAVLELAAHEDRILISADTDFGTLLSLRQETKPSVILLRRPSQRRPTLQAALLLANIGAIQEELQKGCIVVIDDQRLRIRSLPIGGATQA
jgi:predicted nuclease of predicted toxin-antitoxin system